MIDALESAGSAVPPYLHLLEQEHSDRLETAFVTGTSSETASRYLSPAQQAQVAQT